MADTVIPIAVEPSDRSPEQATQFMQVNVYIKAERVDARSGFTESKCLAVYECRTLAAGRKPGTRLA